MSFKKVIVSGVAAAALATSAFAGTGTQVVAADGTGDYLLFPAYYANSAGWNTDLRIVNTNTSNSVVAKVVIRDAKQSSEKVDFMIYLTPGDVWSGVISENAGVVSINSTDDSLVIGGVPANEVSGGYTLVFPEAVNGQVITSGYVEVFGILETNATATYTNAAGTSGLTHTLGRTGNGTQLDTGAVPKRALYQYFNSSAYVAGANDRQVNNADLTGQSVVSAANTDGNLAMTSPATAIEGFMKDGYPKLASDVSAMVGKNTQLSNHVVSIGTTYATTCQVITELEAALDKAASYVIHYGGATIDESAFLATFVSKKYRLDENSGTCHINALYSAKTVPEYAYGQSSDYNVIIGTTPTDMEENIPTEAPDGEISGGTTPDAVITTCDRELCQIAVVNSMGTEGYVTYMFTGTTDDNNTVISPMPYDHRVMSAKSIGGANVTNMVTPSYR